jgi:hypothetical protein
MMCDIVRTFIVAARTTANDASNLSNLLAIPETPVTIPSITRPQHRRDAHR